MPGSITMVPDKNRKIRVPCYGKEIVITIASAPDQGTKKGDDDDRFRRMIERISEGNVQFVTKRDDDDRIARILDRISEGNMQFVAHLPDSDFSVRTVDSVRAAQELLEHNGEGERINPVVIRIPRSRVDNIDELQDLTQHSHRDVHILIIPDLD